jgi:serine/threonine protein kinase
LSLLTLHCTQVEQLHKIFKLCGKPSEEDYWKKMKLPTTFRPPSHYKPSFQEAFRAFPTSSFGLLTTLLALDPTSRGSAASALQNEVSKHGISVVIASGITGSQTFLWLTKALD